MNRTNRLVIPAVIAAAALTACGDHGARKDLPQESQVLDASIADIILFPDRFPNVAHKCAPESTIGIWTMTRDDTWIIYNDPYCGGEGPMIVLDNIPGAKTVSG